MNREINSRQKMIFANLLCILLIIIALVACGHVQNISSNLFGVIEVGASGIKGAIVQTSSNKDEMQVINKLEPDNKTPINPDTLKETGDSINKMFIKIKDNSVPAENIYIVGSSAVAKAPHREKLKNFVQEKTGKVMDFIDVEQEATLIFKGIVPFNQRGQVLTIDIGSGNTKGAFIEKTKIENILTFELAWGTKSFAKKVDEEKGDDNFKKTAGNLRKKILIPKIKEIAKQKSELKNLSQVYLSGGIVWAMTTIMQPDNQNKLVKITDEDINVFYDKLNHNPESLNHGLSKILQVFSINQLIAGTEILKTISDELRFKDKTLFFNKDALHAWSLGYIEEKVKTIKAE